MNIPWDLIIAAVIELVQKCTENQSQDAIQQRLLAPHAMDWLRLRAGLARRGLRRADLDAAMKAAREHLCAATGDDDWAAEIIDQAQVAK